MKIIIFGNLGYLGSSVVKHLRNSFPEAELIGYDIGYFAHCLTTTQVSPEVFLNKQVYSDIRKVNAVDLEGADAVINLAAISNDPMGNKFEQITLDINYKAAVRLAKLAKQSGVKSFVYASSCSVYGSAGENPKKETDEVNPLTTYAKSKIYTEREIETLADKDFTITCLRFATACGTSDRLRLDLVLNDFVAGAFLSNKITILSNGKPWRPLIDTKDMARAIEWAVIRKTTNGGNFLTVNVGSDEWTFQIKPLADAVAKIVQNTDISINSMAATDKRSYRVNFDKFKQLAPNHQPVSNLQATITGLIETLGKIKLSDTEFRDSNLIRLNVISELLLQKSLSQNFEWRFN